MPADASAFDPEKLFLIRAADAQAALEYLTTQPCTLQVYTLVTALLNLQAAPSADAADTAGTPAEKST